jgi:hypothetical protein
MTDSFPTHVPPSSGSAIFLLGRVIAIAGLVFTECSPRREIALGSLRTSNGQMLAAILSGHDSMVMALYDPADCLDCQGVAHEWLAWERVAPSTRQYQIVLSRMPTADEQRHFSLQRLKPLVLSELPHGLTVPRAYWIIAGAIQDSGLRQLGERALLRRVLTASEGSADSSTTTHK